MRAEDAPAIVEMAHELAAAVEDPAPKLAASDLIHHGVGPEKWFDCLVAAVADQILGYALFCRGFEAHTGKKRLWLGDLYVRPAARRRGTGRALMSAVARHALENGCDAVYWELWRMNSTGQALYRALNAEEIGDLAVMRWSKARLAAIARN